LTRRRVLAVATRGFRRRDRRKRIEGYALEPPPPRGLDKPPPVARGYAVPVAHDLGGDVLDPQVGGERRERGPSVDDRGERIHDQQAIHNVLTMCNALRIEIHGNLAL